MIKQVTIYADYVCPYCFLEIGALERLEREYDVQLAWRVFELRPESMPTLEPRGDYLINTWRDSVYPLAARLGIPIQLPPVQPRSRLAFQGAEFARDHERFREYNTGVYQAFFQAGLDIGKPEVLEDVAVGAGLDRDVFGAALADQRYLDRVLEQESEAQALGVQGVPTMFIGEQRFFGCVPYEMLRDAVELHHARGG